MDRATVVALDKAHVWHPYTAMDAYVATGDPIVAVHAEGPWITDADGRRYLDANGSWWTTPLGHRHPHLLRALVAQAGSLTHAALGDCTHGPAAALAARLCALAPGADDPALDSSRKLSHVFFTDNGSTSVEAAIKMVAQYWAQNGEPERNRFLALSGAFHGETLGCTSLGGLPEFHAVFGPLLFDVVRVPSPGEPGGWERAFEALDTALREGGDTIAGVVLEPVIQGAAGMRMHDPAFVRSVRAACDRAGALLVADEVFTGLGRTGARFACDLAGVTPDVLCLAKGLSGGILPFGATLVAERVFRGFSGGPERAFMYGHTYCGHPLGCAVALASLEVLEDHGVRRDSFRHHARIRDCFEHLAARVPGAVHPRSCGMAGAIDLGDGGYRGEAGWKVAAAARRRGIALRPLGDTVYVTPALTLSDDECTLLLDGVVQSVEEAMRSVVP